MSERMLITGGAVFIGSHLADPVDDFETNLQGMLNVLVAARRQSSPPPLLFASANKVYGDLHDVDLEGTRRDQRARA